MSQPKWKHVANLGDASPLDYGGLFVYMDETGVYAPEMERVELVNEDAEEEDMQYEVRRVVLEPCTFIDGVLSDNPYHPDSCAWFAMTPAKMKERPQDGRGLTDVASYIGVEESEVIDCLCSDDPIRRAEAWREILDYHGWDNGDSYPLELTRAECEERYKEELA